MILPTLPNASWRRPSVEVQDPSGNDDRRPTWRADAALIAAVAAIVAIAAQRARAAGTLDLLREAVAAALEPAAPASAGAAEPGRGGAPDLPAPRS
jgi:GAF domain-containing protein